MVPKLLVESLLLRIVVLKSVFLVPAEEETTEAFLAKLVQTWVMFLGVLLLFVCEGLLSHWNCEIGCPLENFQRAYSWTPFLRDLYARCACADDCTTFPFDIDAFFRPE